VSDNNIVSFEAFQLKLERQYHRPPSECEHHRLICDERMGTLECEDCRRSVNPFTAIARLAERRLDEQNAVEHMRSKMVRIRKLLARYKPHLRAAKELESVWRGGKMRPCCPNCRAGLRAEDFLEGAPSCVGVEYDDARRARGALPSP